jgi:RND family efflux transporter MFP subunit
MCKAMTCSTTTCALVLSFVFMSACSNDKNTSISVAPVVKSTFSDETTVVDVARVSQGTFDLEILSNGKALAVTNADIRFPLNENITEVLVKNGDRAARGQVLARLNDTDLKSNLERKREALDKAIVELDDRLIDYGYRLKDSLKVPVEIMRMAKIKSGYNNARYDYADAKTLLEKTEIVAPFSGKVANLEARVYNKPESFKRLCTLIDDSKLLVEFNVLESEYQFVVKGSVVEIAPFGQDVTVKGIVTHVNPVIDGNGMIKITALADNSAGNMLDGMSVKVIVKKPVPNKMFVPKEAVVQRDNRQVVFTYEGGYAKWNYVQTDLQNSKSICIVSGLKVNQQVIVSNNINLAHGAEVQPAK